ncbi:MAG TPA: hypothetical protein VIJ95_06220 [Hanamia sp.]
MIIKELIMTGIIIQARTGSIRLPNKMILPFYEGRGILELLIKKLKINIPEIPIILATTNNAKDDCLTFIGEKLKVDVFRGHENNVLERYIKAAEYFKITKIIRICADNPFLDMNYLKDLLKEFENNSVEYLAFSTIHNIPTIKTHYGFWAEGVSLSALKKVRELTNEKIFLEHVTNFIYSNKESFSQKYITISPEIENSVVRLTVDTIEDFNLAQEIYIQAKKEKISGAIALVKFISTRPKWIQQMVRQIELNTK